MAKVNKQPTVFEVALMLKQWSDVVAREQLTKIEWAEAKRADGMIIPNSTIDQAMQLASLDQSIFTTPDDRLFDLIRRVRAIEMALSKLDS